MIDAYELHYDGIEANVIDSALGLAEAMLNAINSDTQLMLGLRYEHNAKKQVVIIEGDREIGRKMAAIVLKMIQQKHGEKKIKFKRNSTRGRDAYKVQIDESITEEEILYTLKLTLMTLEALHGITQLETQNRFCLDERTLYIDVSTQVGHDMAVIFTDLLIQIFDGGKVKGWRIANQKWNYVPKDGKKNNEQDEQKEGGS